MSVECRVLSGRVLCDELITRPEESYRLWCVVVCGLETSRMSAPYIYDISSLRVKVLLPLFSYFKVCKSEHQHTIQINHQPDATISPVYYLTLIYSSTCFGHPHAHHQELNNCSSSLWFYLRSVVIAVLLVVVGPAGPGKTRGCYCS